MTSNIKLNVDRTIKDLYPGLTRDEVSAISHGIVEKWDYTNLINDVKALTEIFAEFYKIDLEGKDVA